MDKLSEHMDKCPPISRVLVDYLDRMFPPRCPRRSESSRDIWIYVGVRTLVDNLRAEYERQKAPVK